MTAHVSMFLKSCMSPDMLPFSLCNKKRLAIWHMHRPLFPTNNIDFVLHQEVVRAKDLPAPPRTYRNFGMDYSMEFYGSPIHLPMDMDGQCFIVGCTSLNLVAVPNLYGQVCTIVLLSSCKTDSA